MSKKQIQDLIRGAIDLHYHVGIDILPRKYTVEELIKVEDGKIAGVTLKSHSFPTVPAINAALKSYPPKSLILIGSVTLNYFMGGFNPSAVYASAVMSKDYPIMVWFPTIHAKNHLIHNYSEYEIPPDWVKDYKFYSRKKTEIKAIEVCDWTGNLFEKVFKVLGVIKQMKCVLCTGHVSWQEARQLSLEALNLGIKVIVTHPMQRDINMPLEVQKELASRGAFIEYSYITYKDRDNPGDYPPSEMAANITAIGAQQCILVSDSGQIHNPKPSQCLQEFVQLLAAEGITYKEFYQMLFINPRRILGMAM